MSMDPNKWISTLPIVKNGSNREKYKLDSNKWINTLPRRDDNALILSNTINSNQKSSLVKKYSLTIIVFVVGLIIVSAIKNETRNLQKEVSNLVASINTIKLDLHRTTLDHEVITSPENISRLAKEYLEFYLVPYKKSQIKQLNKEGKIFVKPETTEFKKDLKKTVKDKKSEVQLIFAKKIETTKTELAKLQEFYSSPKKIPKKLKLQVSKQIKAKRKELNELKKLSSEPTSIFKSKKFQRWAGLQVVKVFLGIPMVPGK